MTRRHLCVSSSLLAAALLLSPSVHAQVSLSTAVDLAIRNDLKVKIAESDVARSRAVLSETKEAFIPAIFSTAGVGKATGAPLSPPVVFSIAAQSLVFNFSQPDNIRAARSGLESAQLALDVARTDAAEDAINTYLALDNALQRRAAQTQALGIASQLVHIAEDRFNAGVDPHIEVTKARHTEAQIRLQQLLVDDEIASQADHLARLLNVPPSGLETVHSSIPDLRAPASTQDPADSGKSQGISAAFAAAQAKAYTAHGNRHYLFRPQLSFSANYSRIDTAFTTYAQYYPQFGNPGNSLNSLSVGIQITVPLLDLVHRSRARQAESESVRAFLDAQVQQNAFLEGRRKLRHSTAELAARERLAELDHDMAQDQLDATLIRLRAAAGAAGGDQATPKDRQLAELDERQRAIDLMAIDLQLQQAEVTLMREDGSMTDWLAATIPGATSNPANRPANTNPANTTSPAITNPATTTPSPNPAIPATTGSNPAPGTTAPAVPPTTGTTPPALPSSPVTNPSPANPPTAPPATPPTTPHL